MYDNIDNPRNTVTPMLALQRLRNPKIGGFTVSDNDTRKIQRAVEVRNRITHSDVELTGEYAAAKFFELFAFVAEFQRHHLNTRVSEIIPAAEFGRLVQIRKLLDELVERAQARITELQISADFVWECPNCGEKTFVIDEGTDTCFACSHAEAVLECPHCSRLTLEGDMESFFEDLDIDHVEGRTVVLNAYGYRDHIACPECLPRIRQKIQEARSTEEFQRLEEEYHRRNA